MDKQDTPKRVEISNLLSQAFGSTRGSILPCPLEQLPQVWHLPQLPLREGLPSATSTGHSTSLFFLQRPGSSQTLWSPPEGDTQQKPKRVG